MEPTVAAILAATTANAVLLLGGLALWLGHRARRADRLEQRERTQQLIALMEPVEARLAEIARAVDVVAIEVERVAEAQRYLTARGQPGAPVPLVAPPGSAGRTVTPH